MFNYFGELVKVAWREDPDSKGHVIGLHYPINRDNAQLSQAPGEEAKKGGIDFNAEGMDLQTKNDGGTINFTTDPALLKQLQNASGLYPVIINIQPLGDLKLFLGLNSALQEPQKVLT